MKEINNAGTERRSLSALCGGRAARAKELIRVDLISRFHVGVVVALGGFFKRLY